MSYDFSFFKKQLSQAEEWLTKELKQMRTGLATPAVLDGVRVEVYGAPLSLREIASVTLEGSRTLRVSPWDKNQLKDIEKAINVSNLGLSVASDEEGLRVNFPELTSDRRATIVKLAKEKLEEARKEIRRYRDAIVKDLQNKEKSGDIGKDDAFRFKAETQKFTDEVNHHLEDIFAKKEKEILC